MRWCELAAGGPQVSFPYARLPWVRVYVEYCRAINDVRNRPGWYQLKKQAMSSSAQAQYHQQHTAIVTALKDRDGKLAAQYMRDHVISVRNSLLRLEDEDEEI